MTFDFDFDFDPDPELDNNHLTVIISVLLILEKTHVREIQEALFSLWRMEGVNLTQSSSFYLCIIGQPRLVLSAGALVAPNLTILEFTPGSLRSRTGSRGQHQGLRTATANADINNAHISHYYTLHYSLYH